MVFTTLQYKVLEYILEKIENAGNHNVYYPIENKIPFLSHLSLCRLQMLSIWIGLRMSFGKDSSDEIHHRRIENSVIKRFRPENTKPVYFSPQSTRLELLDACFDYFSPGIMRVILSELIPCSPVTIASTMVLLESSQWLEGKKEKKMFEVLETKLQETINRCTDHAIVV